MSIAIRRGLSLCHEEKELVTSGTESQQKAAKEKRELCVWSSCPVRTECPWREREERGDPDENNKGKMVHLSMGGARWDDSSEEEPDVSWVGKMGNSAKPSDSG